MLRKFIGLLANLYPNTVFYSSRFMPDLKFAVDNKVHGSNGSTASLGVAIAAHRLLTDSGDTLTQQFTGVTDRGKDVGDFRITIERLA